MEGVHGVIVRLAEEGLALLVVEGGDLLVAGVGGLQEGRAQVTVPDFRVGHVEAQLGLGVARHHARVAREYRLDAVFLHTFQDFLLQGFLLGVPAVGIRSSPAFEVVHFPPGEESRSGDELVHLVRSVAQLQEQVAPYAFLAHGSQGQVHAVQGHPVDFLFPAGPVPESHTVREGTVVEVVAQAEVRLTAFLLRYARQYSGQFRGHAVPRQVDACMVFQVPVDAARYIYIGVASYHDFVASLVKFEEILVALPELCDELLGGSFVDAFQHTFDRSRRRYGTGENQDCC